MTSADTGQGQRSAAYQSERRFLARFGPVVVTLAIACGLSTVLIFADYTPISPTTNVVLTLFLANAIIILVLAALLAVEVWRLIRAWRAGAAGARLHIRIVGLFSGIAAAPAILIAIVGSITLERSLNPAFMQDVRGFVLNTAEAARLFRESQCRSLLQESRLLASDLDRLRTIYDSDRDKFREFFTGRTKILGFTTAVIMSGDGTVIERADTGNEGRVVTPEPQDFEDAKKNEPLCLILDEGRTFVAVRDLVSIDNTYVYVARPIDPFAVDFPAQAAGLIALYEAFDAHRRNIQIAFATMYVLLALVMLLSATWLGLSFANRLVMPIRRLIAATDQVSSGNLYVQVPVHKSEGDLAHLGETFNKMTSELRLQQNRLIAASNLIDERRLFTEAVLSGVPAAVIGIDKAGLVTVLNPSAIKLLEGTPTDADAAPGRPIEEVVPELGPIIAEARDKRLRLYQGQTTMLRNGRERIFNVRVSTEPSSHVEQSYVVTLDDITDLVSAQRTSAWADVARRIAHEIKNPLTPIQLSAERLKRKYGKLITQDREIFDQCTDTIVRQVDDIKRMVDEFSSFARTPKPRLEEDDVTVTVKQVLFLMKVGHPEVAFEEDIPEDPVRAKFDRRLLSQALTNIIKNATEGLAAREGEGLAPGCIKVRVHESPRNVLSIEVSDNGIGFPTENRQRLLEPYMTTRAEGTGLGLPIVAKILEDHGGGIELLDAEDGPGARVRLYFPMIPRDDASASAAFGASAPNEKA
ncbi:MAG: multi-sensor signal transduction histidine kinase [Hyphomicrobiales bacterium]|nr:multi-sensor signal transduction histidine kinase [Hyphomicrobiales bacterium]